LVQDGSYAFPGEDGFNWPGLGQVLLWLGVASDIRTMEMGGKGGLFSMPHRCHRDRDMVTLDLL
jgi:hypothetical protein